MVEIAPGWTSFRVGPREKKIGPARADCRLIMAINGTNYLVSRNRGDDWPTFKAYRLSKDDGTDYDVAETAYGLTCDCPDFIFHRDGIDPDGCKHIKAMVAYGLLDWKGATQ